MAITFPLAFPTISGISRIQWRAERAGAFTASPLTFVGNSIKYQGQRFLADVTLPVMNRAQAEEFTSFLLKLDGVSGTFLLTPPEGATARGSASTTPGTPVISGASQTGSELDIDGLPASETDYLLAGDYIQLGSSSTTRLHKVVNDVTTDGAGAATLDIWPSLRESPTDGATVVVTSAAGLFRMESQVAAWEVNEMAHFGVTFGIVEVL